MKHVIAAVTLLGTVIGSKPAQAQLAFGEGPCTQALARGVQRLAARITREQVRCHLRRMQVRPDYPYALDCNDQEALPGRAPIRIARAEERLLAAAADQCENLSPPAFYGYATCPFPCDSLPITNYPSVAQCLACVVSEEAYAFTETLYGSWPDPVVGSPNTACQHAVGSKGRKYKLAFLENQLLCERQLMRGLIPDTTNCEIYDPKGRAFRVKAQLDSTIARKCTDSRLASLASCAADVAAEKLCAEVTAQTCATNLLHSLQ